MSTRKVTTIPCRLCNGAKTHNKDGTANNIAAVLGVLALIFFSILEKWPIVGGLTISLVFIAIQSEQAKKANCPACDGTGQQTVTESIEPIDVPKESSKDQIQDYYLCRDCGYRNVNYREYCGRCGLDKKKYIDN